MTRWTLLRWNRWVAGVVLALGVGATTGCLKPLYVSPDADTLAVSVALPPNLDTDPTIMAPPDVAGAKAPPTVLDSSREPRHMTLQEAIAIGLERGNIGSQFAGSLANLGTGGQRGNLFQDDLATSIRPGGGSADDAIRAFALDPAIIATDIEGALAKFDARLTSSMTWRKQDQAVANIFNNFNNGDFAAYSAGLIKPLPTGGTASITTDVNYSKLGAVPAGFAVINPSYTPSVTFALEQPLLRDSGIDINQLLAQHPGSTQTPFRATGGRAEGILVTRLRADQAKHQFEREVNLLLLNVESTYWQLYAAYYAKYAAEQALRQGYVTWEQLQDLQNAGLQTKQGVAQARAQFEEFRSAYLTALQQVIESERQLRGLLGLPFEDGTRIVPADEPTLAPYKPDFGGSLAETLNNRPELQVARQEVKIQQLNLMLAHNNVRPDLRLFANYNVNSIGNTIGGRGPVPAFNAQGQQIDIPGNAFAALADNRFSNWVLGVRLDYPIGNRDAYASMKAAQLALARTHVSLHNQELKAGSQISSIYQQLAATYEQIKIQRNRRIALGTQLEGQFERVKIGKDPLIQLLDAQNRFADAIRQEAQAVANYNIALSGFEYVKGTIQRYNNVYIADGPLPTVVSERAADHFAAKAAGLRLRERPAHLPLPQDEHSAPPLPGLVEKPHTLEELKADKSPNPFDPPKSDPMAPAAPPAKLPPLGKPADPVAPPKVSGGVSAPATLPVTHFGPALGKPAATEPDVLPATPVSTYRK